MVAPHLRHLPDLMQEIVRVDRDIADLRGSTDFRDAQVLRSLRARRGELTARAHEIYGHTPARGDRGPSSAGALAA